MTQLEFMGKYDLNNDVYQFIVCKGTLDNKLYGLVMNSH